MNILGTSCAYRPFPPLKSVQLAPPVISLRKVILLTGASIGLGLALAKQLIKCDRYFLVLTAKPTSLHRFKRHSIEEGDNVWIRALNISDHDNIALLMEEINERLGGVDILINNAGVTENATVEDSDYHCRVNQLIVNYLCPFQIITHALPLMRKKRGGHILNISSAGGFMVRSKTLGY